MKKEILIMAFALLMISEAFAQVKVGDKAPDFKLVNTDYTQLSLSDYKDEAGVILIFTCNHCPYAKFYEARIDKLHRAYAPKGYPVVAINPNDSVQYKTDGFSHMVKKGYEYAYLLDNTGVYKAYGASKTPHTFLLTRVNEGFKVAYIGAIDDSPQDANQVKVRYLENAISAVMAGKEADPNLTKAIGCSIKPF